MSNLQLEKWTRYMYHMRDDPEYVLRFFLMKSILSYFALRVVFGVVHVVYILLEHA